MTSSRQWRPRVAGSAGGSSDARAEVLGAPAEHYAFTWPGKAGARRRADAPCAAELAPVADATGTLGATPDTQNLLIEGDNLAALQLLLPEYAGRVRLIYIDPPYNTGNHFIFADRYAGAPLAARASADPRARAHTRWLSMLYPRLLLARALLREDGALCLSIGEHEVHHARLLLDEVFGEEQHRNTIAVRRHDKNLSRQFMRQGLVSLAVGFEYVLVYARGPAFMMRPVFRAASARRRACGYWKGFWNAADRPTMRYPLLGVTPDAGQWKWRASIAREAVENYARYQALADDGALSLEDYWAATGERLRFIRRNPAGHGRNQGVEHWIPPSAGILRTSDWTDLLASESLAASGLPFDSPKRVELLKLLIRLCADEEALVLDFFAGSGTTAQAVLELNREQPARRRFMLAQLPEPTGDPRFPTITAITRARVGRAIARLSAPPDGPRLGEDLGCRVLRVVPHGAQAADAADRDG